MPHQHASPLPRRAFAHGRLELLAGGAAGAPPATARNRAHEVVVAAYNATRELPEIERPRQLLARILAGVGKEHHAYVERLLSASCLSFEPNDEGEPAVRFAAPSFCARRTLGLGYLSWVARPLAGGDAVDLWVSAHHVGLDGVPLQDCLNRLTRAWGRAAEPVFPGAVAGTAFLGPRPCHAPGERPVDELTMFVDLAPVLALRRRAAERFGKETGGEVTLGTLLAWLLTGEPEFADVRVASTVDIPSSHGYERDVDVVSLRPADYRSGPGPWDGFASFAREFNRLIALCRERTSPVRVGMQTAGLLPAWAHSTLVHSNPAALDDTFGTLCITIIRDAQVFIAPMTDLGLRHGFFAIGSAALPAPDGTQVASVSVKGDAGRIAQYPAVLQRAIERASQAGLSDWS